jgi:hypothetical protein
MYEFLFGACILRCLKPCMNFYLKHGFFLMYFKIPYDFTIRFYDPSLLPLFHAKLKMCF